MNIRDKLDFYHVKNLLVMMLAVIVMSSCARLEYKRDYREAKKQLMELCEKDAGFFVYETAEADGYYDASTRCHGCWQDLIKSNYQYIEFCHEEDESPLSHIIYKKGCYKVYKEKKGSENCHREINEELAKKIYSKIYPTFLKNQCIAVKAVKHPTSQFIVSSRLNIWKNGNKNIKFVRSEEVIKDDEEKIKGRFVNYSFMPVRGEAFNAKRCYSLNRKFLPYRQLNVHETILKPVDR